MSWIKVAGINIALICILALLVEFFFGKWGNNDYPNLESQIIKKTYIDRSLAGITPEQITIYPQPNGFRYSSHLDFNANNDCLIVTMGGSTTQEFILSQKETWSQQLQDRLNLNKNDKCSNKYLVMNVGMSGHSILNNLWLLKNYIYSERLNPISIIVYQGINDLHLIFNSNSKNIKLRHLKSEIFKDIRYRSFIYNTVTKVANYFSEDSGNHSIDNNYNGDGLLFRLGAENILNYEEIALSNSIPFVYEELDEELIANANKWSGVIYHKKTVQEFVNFAQKYIPKAKLIFITQTKSFCDLTEFPTKLGYKKKLCEVLPEIPDSCNVVTNTPPDQFSENEWLSRRGKCFRLSFVKQNYISVADSNTEVEVIDYAGMFVEQLNESYDWYHKNPYGSRLFFDRVGDSLLCKLSINNCISEGR